MGDYSVFAKTGNSVVQMLSEKLNARVRLVSPGESEEDYQIGVYLYDLKEDREITLPEYTKNEHSQLEKSPKFYTLYYLIYVNQTKEITAEGMQEYIGKITQILNDNELPDIQMTPVDVTLEEKNLLWQALNKSYQLGLYYQLNPVVLSSEVVIDVPLVQEKYFSVEEAT